MTQCPYCGAENIEGVDICQHCAQSLTDMHLPPPVTGVERALLHDRVEVLEPRECVTVAVDTPVAEVLRTLVELSIGSVVVVEGEEVVGIFSERDALMKLNDQVETLADRPISEFMTRSPQTLLPTAKVAFAVQRMDLGGYRHVPIVDEAGRATGIVSVRDILRYLTERMATS